MFIWELSIVSNSLCNLERCICVNASKFDERSITLSVYRVSSTMPRTISMTFCSPWMPAKYSIPSRTSIARKLSWKNESISLRMDSRDGSSVRSCSFSVNHLQSADSIWWFTLSLSGDCLVMANNGRPCIRRASARLNAAVGSTAFSNNVCPLLSTGPVRFCILACVLCRMNSGASMVDSISGNFSSRSSLLTGARTVAHHASSLMNSSLESTRFA